ncbi:hypothetical protein D9M69_685040 [compost metagenome]
MAAHCWWVAGREDERQVFDGQVNRAQDQVLPGGHYELLQQGELLAELDQLLAPEVVTLP